MNKEHKKYLDELRESGVTNMYGARPYIMDEFGIDETEASQMLSDWMKGYGFGRIGK